MKSSPFRLGLVQMSMGTDVDDNVEKAIAGVRQAAERGAQIICLPELFRTQYFCQREDASIFDLAEAVPGPTTEIFGRIAKETGTVIITSLFERRSAGLYHNTAAVLDADGRVAGIYRKMHIPDDPLYYEKYYFTPGDLGFCVFPTRFAKVGTLVCWDQWYPEGARLTAMKGAELLVYPTAIGWHPAEKAEYGAPQHAAWETIQRSHAIANGLFVAAVNRTGHEGPKEGGIDFWGASFVSDPSGVLLAKGSHDGEEVLVVECDPNKAEMVRRNWPFLRDRRIDAYEGLTRRWLD
jgi:N-carbamoylputrescine amidase